MRSQSISIKVFLLFTVILFPLAPKFAPGGLQALLAWETMTMIGDRFPQKATFTTLITTPRALEGLTGDNHGNLYTGRFGHRRHHPITPVLFGKSIIQQSRSGGGWEIAPNASPFTCGFAGIAFE